MSVFVSHLAAQLLTNPLEPLSILIKTFLRSLSNLRIIVKNYVSVKSKAKDPKAEKQKSDKTMGTPMAKKWKARPSEPRT